MKKNRKKSIGYNIEVMLGNKASIELMKGVVTVFDRNIMVELCDSEIDVNIISCGGIVNLHTTNNRNDDFAAYLPPNEDYQNTAELERMIEELVRSAIKVRIN